LFKIILNNIFWAKKSNFKWNCFLYSYENS